MKQLRVVLIVIGIFLVVSASKHKPYQAATKPNIIIIMADDMGFSDIGCYGSEIPTPNIDMLAKGGMRFKQFYNNARCCPTRATLLTGLYPHQAGIGAMSEDPESVTAHDEGVDGYRGYLTKKSVTIAEVLKTSGYHTYMSGKWHVGMHGKEKWPLQRGFERYYGILCGASSYMHPFFPRGITADNGETQYNFPADYYTTDAFGENAVNYIKEQKDKNPFFLYLAFTAPHWPLQAKKEDIEHVQAAYAVGWDSIKHERLRKQIAMGLARPEWKLTEKEMRPWKEVSEQDKKNEAYRMSVYAAMVYRMDLNIGRLIQTLKDKGSLANSLIFFLSDNGACAEPYQEMGGRPMAEINDPLKYGAISYGMGWANTSNTPFRKYKTQTYEGGISAPLIVYWPGKIKAGSWNDTRYHIIDLMATAVEAAGAKYPATYDGNKIFPSDGLSMVPSLKGGKPLLHDAIYWEHEGHCAMMQNNWKIVKPSIGGTWELYELEHDRTEMKNVAAAHPDIVKSMNSLWQKWADSHQVFPKGKDYKDNTSNHPNKYAEE